MIGYSALSNLYNKILAKFPFFPVELAPKTDKRQKLDFWTFVKVSANVVNGMATLINLL